jgi:hypothetical protein
LNPDKLVKYSVPLFAFAIVSRAIEEISFFYYSVPMMCLLFIVLLLKSSRFKVQLTNQKENPESDIRYPASSIGPLASIIHHPLTILLLPGLWFLLTSLWSAYPGLSATRALYFILISTGCISAGVLWLRYSGKDIFNFLLPVNIFIVLLCLFSIISNIPSDSWSGGHGKGFMGFFGHQNLLASVLLFTMPSVVYKIVILAKSRIRHDPKSDSQQAGMTDTSMTSIRQLVNSKQLTVNSYQNSTVHYLQLTAYSLLLIANLLVLILTYSRASLLSLVFGVIAFLILNKNWKVISYSFGILFLFFLIVYLTPSLNQLADKILKKDFPEIYSSRIWMWEPSYQAAIEGGLTGLGYGISEPNIKPGSSGDHFEGKRFVREKGNSVLALIEETGLIGLILFLFPISYVASKLSIKNYQLKIKSKHYSLFIIHYSLLSAIAAFILHSQFEAWWIGVGSVQLPLFFVYIGLLVRHQQTNIQ